MVLGMVMHWSTFHSALTLPQDEPHADPDCSYLSRHAFDFLTVSCALDVLPSIKHCDRLEVGDIVGRRSR